MNNAGAVSSVNPRRIVAAAILLTDGRIVCGVRHFDKIMREVFEGMANSSYGSKAAGIQALVKGSVQGFVANDYEFESREAAWLIALRAGQFDPKNATGTQGTLYSEDLW